MKLHLILLLIIMLILQYIFPASYPVCKSSPYKYTGFAQHDPVIKDSVINAIKSSNSTVNKVIL